MGYQGLELGVIGLAVDGDPGAGLMRRYLARVSSASVRVSPCWMIGSLKRGSPPLLLGRGEVRPHILPDQAPNAAGLQALRWSIGARAKRLWPQSGAYHWCNRMPVIATGRQWFRFGAAAEHGGPRDYVD